MYDELDLDVLIIGGGGAGLMAALHVLARDPRLRVGVAAKGLAWAERLHPHGAGRLQRRAQ